MSVAELLPEAAEFLASAELDETSAGRFTAVRAEVLDTGTYGHTGPELTWGARIAWRNTVVCIGRSYGQWIALRPLPRLALDDQRQDVDAVLEVPLSHPDLPWFADLGLRWYAHPAIADQRLRIGGVDYPAAPFSGWYTATEISAENLARRYRVLPDIAQRMGLDTTTTRTLWLDRALVELTAAVLHSYQQHGVVIVDHHQAAKAFTRHESRELAAGRPVYGRYSALVAPTAAATTDMYYRTHHEKTVLPNFFPPAPVDAGCTPARQA